MQNGAQGEGREGDGNNGAPTVPRPQVPCMLGQSVLVECTGSEEPSPDCPAEHTRTHTHRRRGIPYLFSSHLRVQASSLIQNLILLSSS